MTDQNEARHALDGRYWLTQDGLDQVGSPNLYIDQALSRLWVSLLAKADAQRLPTGWHYELGYQMTRGPGGSMTLTATLSPTKNKIRGMHPDLVLYDEVTGIVAGEEDKHR